MATIDRDPPTSVTFTNCVLEGLSPEETERLLAADRRTVLQRISPEASAALSELAETHGMTRGGVVDALARYVRERPGVLAAALEQDRRRGRNDG